MIEIAVSAKVKSGTDARSQRQSILSQLIMDSLDIWIPATNLGYGNLNDGTVGLFGWAQTIHPEHPSDSQCNHIVHGPAGTVAEARGGWTPEVGLSRLRRGRDSAHRGGSERQMEMWLSQVLDGQ